jgi:hypothetical protein
MKTEFQFVTSEQTVLVINPKRNRLVENDLYFG